MCKTAKYEDLKLIHVVRRATQRSELIWLPFKKYRSYWLNSSCAYTRGICARYEVPVIKPVARTVHIWCQWQWWWQWWHHRMPHDGQFMSAHQHKCQMSQKWSFVPFGNRHCILACRKQDNHLMTPDYFKKKNKLVNFVFSTLTAKLLLFFRSWSYIFCITVHGTSPISQKWLAMWLLTVADPSLWLLLWVTFGSSDAHPVCCTFRDVCWHYWCNKLCIALKSS